MNELHTASALGDFIFLSQVTREYVITLGQPATLRAWYDERVVKDEHTTKFVCIFTRELGEAPKPPKFVFDLHEWIGGVAANVYYTRQHGFGQVCPRD